MTPQSEQPKLKGSTTTVAGVSAIVMGGFGIFTEIWRAAHVGGALDAGVMTPSISAILSGIGLIYAADSKQQK